MSHFSPRRPLFVCTGNICRSPMAAFLAEKLAQEAGLELHAASAGTAAEVGMDMTPEAARALAARGISATRHEARQLDAALLNAADHVYALTRAHRAWIVARFPAHAAKVAVLRQAAGLTDADVADPYGLSQAVYEECASRIEEALDIILRRNNHVEHSR
ncbi:MAG: low molecular weight protein arginine phosphatase [Elusimicrobia bacterium]|nr:low molecular weight protein arginine phosphatase [Elusimicrobiota bacterium]